MTKNSLNYCNNVACSFCLCFDILNIRIQLNFDAIEIIDIYRGLWRIEESFKITKSDLNARPVYLSREDRIKAHFLICYIALVIARILQHRVENKYSVTQILGSLGKVCCSHFEENLYLFDYRDEVTDAVGKAMNIDFTKKYRTLGEIKKILGEVKKS